MLDISKTFDTILSGCEQLHFADLCINNAPKTCDRIEQIVIGLKFVTRYRSLPSFGRRVVRFIPQDEGCRPTICKLNSSCRTTCVAGWETSLLVIPSRPAADLFIWEILLLTFFVMTVKNSAIGMGGAESPMTRNCTTSVWSHRVSYISCTCPPASPRHRGRVWLQGHDFSYKGLGFGVEVQANPLPHTNIQGMAVLY